MLGICRGRIIRWATLGSIALLLLAPLAGLAAGRPSASTDEAARVLPAAGQNGFSVFLPAVPAESDGDFPSCRLGVGVVKNPAATYNFAPFRVGWYVDWRASAPPLPGVEYYHTIRVRQDRAPDGTYLSTYRITPPLSFSASGLGPIVQANPGHLWLIGNEPDRVISQDDTMPDKYAEIYHEAYYFIKGIDPTARVAIGAVVQPTPLRLEYLQSVLSAYQARYGTRLPADVWNTHLYIIREVRGEWGADVPPGSTAASGRIYTLEDHLDINVLISLVVELRTWLKANGYQDIPLIVTEFGALMPLWFLSNVGYTQADVDRFLEEAVGYMESAVDPALGFAADGYRLVQQAAIYSLDDDSTFPDGLLQWGSFLLRSTSPYTVTETGTYFRDVIAANMYPTVDLLPYRATARPLITGSDPTVSPVVRVSVANAGNSVPGAAVTVRFFDVTGGQPVQVGTDVVIPAFTGCGTMREASVVWPDLAPGYHRMSIEVDPDDDIEEILETNNVMVIEVLVTRYGVHLPLTMR